MTIADRRMGIKRQASLAAFSFVLVVATSGAISQDGGRKIGAYVIAQAAPAPEILLAALMEEGEPIYRANCLGCHGDDLAGNDTLASTSSVVGQILEGDLEHAGMPPFAGTLNDREVAAVATYIRNSWGNSFGVVMETRVADARAYLAEGD